MVSVTGLCFTVMFVRGQISLKGWAQRCSMWCAHVWKCEIDFHVGVQAQWQTHRGATAAFLGVPRNETKSPAQAEMHQCVHHTEREKIFPTSVGFNGF